MTDPVAGFVRLALPAESQSIAAVQRRVWGEQVPTEVGQAMLAAVSVEEMDQAWHRAITRPPSAAHRVLVATERDVVVGYATTTPAQDTDGEPGRDGQLDELAIDPAARRRGHGSRLLHAGIDTLRADGFVRARCWLSSTDDVLRQFLVDAGWAPDGSSRELGSEESSLRLRQVRVHTALD